jgi:hypothetical protein
MITPCYSKFMVIICMFITTVSMAETEDLSQALARKDILVLYHLASQDVTSVENFIYFLNFTALKDTDKCDYIIFMPSIQMEVSNLMSSSNIYKTYITS